MKALWRKPKIWGIGVCALLLIGAFVAYFGPQVYTYMKFRPSLRRGPSFPPRGWAEVPKPLRDTTVSKAEGSPVSYYGCQFEVPWGTTVKQYDLDYRLDLLFANGRRIEFVNPSHFPNAFAGGRSKYEQFKAMISTRPADLSPLSSHATFARTFKLLDQKGFLFEHNGAVPDIFSFRTPAYRGFEVSGLSRGWEWVQLNLFDSSNRWFELTISVDPSSDTKLSQPEINRVIQSFGPASAAHPSDASRQ